jgi:hypothetical protein
MGKSKRAPAKPLVDVLDDLAERIERLSISRHDPHKFFEDRDELAKELRALRAELTFR